MLRVRPYLPLFDNRMSACVAAAQACHFVDRIVDVTLLSNLLVMRTTRKEPQVKETRAGIALKHTAKGNNLLSLTLVTGPPHDGVFADPTEHELQDQTPATLATALSRILTTPTSIALSLPVALTDDELKQYRDAVRELPGMEAWYTMDHSTAYLNHIIKEFKEGQEHNVLFLDLKPPGQAAAKLSTVETDDGQTIFFSDGKTVQETALDAIENLVKPTINPPLHAIYILCPTKELGLGLGFEPLLSDLKLKFPHTLVRFVTLSEVSRGAAASRERHQGVITTQILCAFFTPLPTRVALADGRRVECVARNRSMPLETIVTLTTARENQSSATLEFSYGDCPIGKVIIEGLVAARPRIQVSVSCDDEGDASVCVEEVGKENKVVASLSVDNLKKEEIEAYLDAHREECGCGGEEDEAGEGDVLGELPE